MQAPFRAASPNPRGADFFEYEWAITVSAEQVPAVVEALGGQPGDDVLAGLRSWYEGPEKPNVQRMLADHGIDVDFWSRVGE